MRAEPPRARTQRRQVFLDQGWSTGQRTWFHHASKGTTTFGIPYEWFMAFPALDLDSDPIP